MGAVSDPPKVMTILAAFSRHDAALDWARDWGVNRFGSLILESPRFTHDETTYYDDEMGAGLKKTFFAFDRLIDPSEIVQSKIDSNLAESQYASQSGLPEPRPLNLDPGYLSESKFVLATTKDHAHRLYLDRGIYAEITLRYRKGGWQPWEWTYPDYCRDDYREWFKECRVKFRELAMRPARESE